MMFYLLFLKLMFMICSRSTVSTITTNRLLVCVEELYQSIRIEDFERLFFVLEEIIHKYGRKDNKIFLPLLRICNGILNKLSCTYHTEFIGRIHKLIANVFPLSHKSGVNLKGTFNDKITIDTSEDAEMELESNILLGSQDKETPKLSFEFYKNFWLLQKYISDPFQV